MLDKAGVATLLRLMFIPQQGSSKMMLNGILHDVSKNSQNRAEVVSLLLSILQDGSADVNAVERSFTHLSLRAKQPATQKTPQPPLKKTVTGPIASAANSMEATPLMVIQVYGPDYEKTGDLISFHFTEGKARELYNHLGAFLRFAAQCKQAQS